MEKVLFRGTKTFWKTKNSIEIAVIDHCDFDIFEVVAFEPALQVEAPRLYVDAQVLRHILNLDNPGSAAQKGQSSNSADGFDPLGTFVFNHLFITTLLPSSKKFVVEVRRGYLPNGEEGDEGLVVSRPAQLVPCTSPFGLTFSEGSSKSVSPRSAALREKWRLPFILVRLSKGLPLTTSDVRIWNRFMEGKSPEQLIDSMAKALATKVKEEPVVLQRAAHAIMLPQQSPFPAPRSPHSPSGIPSEADTFPSGLTGSLSHTIHDGTWPSGSTRSPGKSGLPPLQRPPGSGDSRGRSRHRNVFKRDGTLSTTSSGRSSPASGASSANSSPAGSRDSSPARIGMLGGLLRRSPSPSTRLTTGVGYGDCSSDGMRRPSFGESIMHTMQRGLGLGMSHSAPSSPQLEGSHTDAVSGRQSIDGTQALTALGAGLNASGTTTESPRKALLRYRRRTFDTRADVALDQPLNSGSVRTYPGHHRVGSDGQALPTNAPTAATGAHHVRSGSGGMAGIGSLLGLSGGHRVVPVSTQGAMTAWEDNEAVFGSPK